MAAQATSDGATPSSPTTVKPPRGLFDELPPGSLRKGENQFLTLNIENDLFGGGNTDRHYTSGLRLSYFDLREKPPAFSQNIGRWMPFLTTNENTGVLYSIGHNIYTPDDISSPVHRPNQRPWAAFLYGSVGLVTVVNDHVDELELTLGMVGPAALGEPIQKTWHRLIGATQPRGWRNQLQNEPALIIAGQRRWPEWYRWHNDIWNLAIEPSIGFTGGNIYTYANSGLNVKFGPHASRFQDNPVRVRPAMPGTGFYARSTDDRWASWYLFAGANGRAVGRNIFLDGNSFDNDTPHVDKRILVGDLDAGVAITLGRARLSYSTVYRTREYTSQDSNDLFGVLNLGYRF